MGRRKDVKLNDIAHALGISVVSVSNALNGKKGVSEERRQEILLKAQEMGYATPRLENSQSKAYCQVGVIMAERYMKEYPSFYMDVYQRTVQEAIYQNYLTVLEIVDWEMENLKKDVSLFRGLDIKGIVVIGEMNPIFIRQVKTVNMTPVVCIGTYCLEKDMDFIVTDNFHGAQCITQKLIDAGHRDIAFVDMSVSSHNDMDRYMGYCKALKLNGLDERSRISVWNDSAELELPKKLPSAFVCGCAKSAQILLDELMGMGMRIPEDISVAGCDCAGIKNRKHLVPESYESDKNALAYAGINTLRKRIAGIGKTEGIQTLCGNVVSGNTIGTWEE